MSWHIVTCEYPPQVGGIADHSAQLAEGLARAGESVDVWCPGGPRPVHAGVRIHPELGTFGARDLEQVDRALDACPAPRRLLVQWVPHGFGRRSMNIGFCRWVARRARRGDQVHLVVHEPYLELWTGSVLRVGVAVVHRVMTAILLRAAHRVWLSTPSWEPRLRPYALGRPIEMRWLPVPGCECSDVVVGSHRTLPTVPTDRPLVGHLGSYGTHVAPLLEARLAGVMDGPSRPAALLLGQGGDEFARGLLARHPAWTGRVHAPGVLAHASLAEHVAACDILLQPYPDGITTRRTSAMAGLAHGRAVVTTVGALTEPLWRQLAAVELVDVDDVPGFIRVANALLADAPRRARLGLAAQGAYHATFSVGRLVSTLRAA